MGLNLGLSLIQNMKQELRMTPQLQMAIRHLQLSRADLIEEIQQELMSNPLLEEASQVTEDYPSQELTQENTSSGRRERRRERERQSHDQGDSWSGNNENVGLSDLDSVEGAHKARMEMDWERYINDDGRREIDQIKISEDEYFSPELTYSRSRTLSEHLEEQVALSDFTDCEKNIARVLIGNLNERGYLKGLTAEEVSIDLEVDIELVEEVIESIQQFDPLGVCARNVRECLLAQCKALNLNQQLYTIIDKHLKDIERNRLPQIAKAMNLTVTKVVELVDELKRLDPTPGSQYTAEPLTYVTPDFYIDWIDDELKVRVNDVGMPRLKVNRFYREQIRNTNDNEGKKYVTERLNAAYGFMKSLEQRKQTIVQVMECILEVQKDFFIHGPEHLKPLVLRQIAEQLGYHESTISRVTSNKYVYTPKGLFEIKFFFSSKIQGSQGNEDLAGEAVKSKIKRLIAEENPQKPLSDQKIVKLLQEDGVSIARRTVAKYREALGIGSSSQRRSHIRADTDL